MSGIFKTGESFTIRQCFNLLGNHLITIVFGSNRMIDTNGVCTFIDEERNVTKELFKVELRGDLQPMITVEIRDKLNKLLGKAYRSTGFVTWDKENYEIIEEREGSETKRLALKRKTDGCTIFEMIKKDGNEVEINGVFHIKGYPHMIEATPDFLQTGTNQLIDCRMGCKGKGIVLTRNSIGF